MVGDQIRAFGKALAPITVAAGSYTHEVLSIFLQKEDTLSGICPNPVVYVMSTYGSSIVICSWIWTAGSLSFPINLLHCRSWNHRQSALYSSSLTFGKTASAQGSKSCKDLQPLAGCASPKFSRLFISVLPYLYFQDICVKYALHTIFRVRFLFYIYI